MLNELDILKMVIIRLDSTGIPYMVSGSIAANFYTTPRMDREDLIISKLYWAKDSLSEMQIRDVENLMSTLPELDREYIAKWVQQLGIEEVYKRVNR